MPVLSLTSFMMVSTERVGVVGLDLVGVPGLEPVGVPALDLVGVPGLEPVVFAFRSPVAGRSFSMLKYPPMYGSLSFAAVA